MRQPGQWHKIMSQTNTVFLNKILFFGNVYWSYQSITTSFQLPLVFPTLYLHQIHVFFLLLLIIPGIEFGLFISARVCSHPLGMSNIPTATFPEATTFFLTQQSLPANSSSDSHAWGDPLLMLEFSLAWCVGRYSCCELIYGTIMSGREIFFLSSGPYVICFSSSLKLPEPWIMECWES